MSRLFVSYRFCTLAVLIFLALSAAIPVVAQVDGSLTGRVMDPSGAAIPGAIVGISLPGGKSPLLTGKTDDAGIFAFIAVNSGLYEVSVEAQGFAKTVIGNVKVDPVQEKSLGVIKLELQGTAQAVEVTTDTQSVQLATAEVSSTITSTQVENLPV